MSLRKPLLRATCAGLLALSAATLAPGVDVGTGSPSEAIKLRFINAYFRNGFSNLVSLPPINDVQRFGPTGLIQEFRDVNKTTGVKLALIRPNATGPILETKQDVLQVLANLYAYYGQVGQGAAGYPVDDTLRCPSFPDNSCEYQFFDKNYVLFAYSTPIVNGQNFSIRQNFYTKWVALGGIGGLGRPVDTEETVTIQSIGATRQIYSGGSVYTLTSGALNGKTFAVLAGVDQLYAANDRENGFLGLPTSDEYVLAGGRKRQTFQGGAIEYDAGGTPVLLKPVSSVVLTPISSGALRLNVGDTHTLTARTLSDNGADLPGRFITWTTSNSRVVAITPAGNSVTLKAVSGGNAVIVASSEGKSSPQVNVSVTAPCCQIGEGAPSPSIQQAFQDAVTRNRLQIQLPAASPVKRAGAGYAQELYSMSTPAVRYLLAKPDRVAAAYVLSGDLLARYEQLGGPGGGLGHPLADPTAGGRQLFENGALAGSPPRLVSGPILAAWSLMGYETGAAGPPLGDAAALLSSSAVPALEQAFVRGRLLAATAGPRAGQAFFVAGPILARYLALGGASGPFGLPVSDEFGANNRRRQNFEGGYFDYGSGETLAADHLAERRPALSAFPASVVAGSRLRVALSGFPDGAAVRVSLSGQPDFVAPTQNGAFGWDIVVPLTAPSATIRVRAVDPDSGASAETTYTVRSLTESRLQLAKAQGDGQTGPPGAVLPQRIRVVLRDEAGNPVSGATVAFTASPGAQVFQALKVTNPRGEAETSVRLPSAEGIALVTAESYRAVATFSFRTQAAQLSNFPRLTQALDAPLGPGPATVAQKGALLAAAASIVRYYQNRGEAAGAPADVATLNQALKNYCAADAGGRQICDGFLSRPGGDPVVNLWRIAPALGALVDVCAEPPDAATVRDLVAQGVPALLALSLSANDAPAGGHYVVATGIAADGGILIHDPSPAFARTVLSDYLAGFASSGRVWKGVIASVLRISPRAPAAGAFLLAAVSLTSETAQNLAMAVDAPAGPCGLAVDLPDPAATPDSAWTGRTSHLYYCDGSQSAYQVTLGAPTGAPSVTATDLSSGGRSAELSASGAAAVSESRAAAYLASMSGGRWTFAPLSLSLASAAVVNAATFTAEIAPGGLAALFGRGLAGAGAAEPGQDTAIEVGGAAATILGRTPFQVNFEIPGELAPGPHLLRVRSPFGAAEGPIDIRPVAPAIFVLAAKQGAVVNQDGKLNSPSSPARRGQALIVFATGLGAVDPRPEFSTAREPVTAVLNGAELRPLFAGLAPGFAGLYQVNVLLPADQAPGLDLPLLLRQGGVDSNPVFVSVQ